MSIVSLLFENCHIIKATLAKDIDYLGYYNMKSIYDDRYGGPENEDPFSSKALPLSAHPNFEDSLVNLDNSAVHVPINVYEVSGH